MIALSQAQQRIIAACEPLAAQSVPLADALDRVLAENAYASDDLVPFARSAMDGFAVRASDTAGSPVALPISGTIYAQAGTFSRHRPATATAIATGAPLPDGADAVLPIENVVVERGSIRVMHGIEAGTHVFPPGEDARRGDLLATAGTLLGPGVLGLLAAAGHANVRAVRRPRVAIVCSGEELVAVDETPGFGQIRNSNATLVAATMIRFGADIVRSSRVRDDAAALRAELELAFAAADLVITTGGASVGERDLVKPALRDLGVRFEFESVALRPARPTGFGRYGASLVAVLAGNPAAAFVALHELVRPAVFRLAGRHDELMPRVRARLNGSVHGKAHRTYLPFVRVRIDAGGFVAIPLDNQCSALTRTASDANGFAVVGPEAGALGSGDAVAVDMYDWSGVDDVRIDDAGRSLRDSFESVF